MDADELLKQVTIPSSCPAKWESMTGDDRIRSCASCGKDVHDFAALTPDEIAALLTRRGGDLCGRIARG